MGQTNSRRRPSSVPVSTTDRHIDDINTDALPSDSPAVHNVPSQAVPSRRSSVRKSILNFIKPSTSTIRRRVDSAASGARKTWRHSKRWSKVSPDLSQTAESSSSRSPETSTAPSSPVSEKGKGVERDTDTYSVEHPAEASDRPSTPFPPTIAEASTDTSARLPRMDREISHNLGAWLSAQNQSQGPSQRSNSDMIENNDEVVISPDQFEAPHLNDISPAIEARAGVPTEAPSDEESPVTQQASGRHFPPPGTLVVVQGVVHTTDVPRPSVSTPHLDIPIPTRRSSSTPPTPSGSERGNGARNRLSALLRSRPASTVTSRPSSLIDPSPSTTSPPTIIEPAVVGSGSPPAEASNTSHPNIVDTDSSNPPAATAPSNEPRPGSISSSSIDVLGTLLSVAAAATAASLLTGSSEPILSSGLAPPYNANDPSSNPILNHSHASNVDPWNSRPTSPTPTAGLGMGIGADPSAAGHAERLRHTWGSIRERLGLRPAPPHPTLPLTGNPMLGPHAGDERSTTPAVDDPREIMLAQMARAFNLGFGLAGDASAQREREADRGSATQEQGGEESAPRTEPETSPQLPLEGSFERFLVDLQADLRVALTSPNLLSEDASTTAQQPFAAPLAREPEASVTSTAPETRGQAYAAPEIGEDDNFRGFGDVTDSDSEFDDETEDDTDYDDDRTSSSIMSAFMPVQEQAQSHSAHPEQQAHPTSDDGRSNPPSAPAAPAIGNADLGNERAGDINDGSRVDPNSPGRINWWRLYRFPPIIAPRPQGADPVSPMAPSPFGFANASPSTDPPPPTVMDPTLSELPFATSSLPVADVAPTERVNHAVIPVIVVGLQSVNTNWQDQLIQDENDDSDMFGENDADEADILDENNDNRQNEFEGPMRNTARGRPWRSRAAHAIRNLRPTRRNRAAPAAVAPGSRTFLIYVIGGYYPPDHSIVTGGPNSLDSFETLLELAELLGQAKPPTVSKEDIEKSGLEIIKPARLAQYEKAGKISSNCTERCLICLDDYEPEADIRVMKCRHAFHKKCVDKWLETGKNNCPACRSKGVSINAPLSTAGA